MVGGLSPRGETAAGENEMMTPTEPTTEPNGQTERPVSRKERLRAGLGRLPVISALAAVLLLFGLATLAWTINSRGEHPIYPILPTYTPLAVTVDYQPVLVGFAELNADPAAFLGQRIQVSGAYTPVEPPECVNYSGPPVRWSLVAEELQLNAMGFENLLRLVDEGLEMTVTGIWSAYHGPVGCGKEPPDGTIWYLMVDRIVEPNPLLGAVAPALTVIPGEPLPTQAPFETAEPGLPTPEETPEGDLSPFPSPTLDSTFPITPGITPETTPLPVTPLPTPGTPPPGTTTTPGIGETPGISPTPDLTQTAEATPGEGETPPPGFPTTTPGGPGYPGPPEGTPTPTTPSGGYP